MTDYIDKGSVDEVGSPDYTSLMGKIVQRGGKKFIYAYAGAALTAKTPYRLTYGGLESKDPTVAALADGAIKNKVVVPERTLANGDRGWFQIEGVVEDMVVPSASYTATHMLKVHDGAVTSLAAAYAGADSEFATVIVGGTTVTAIDVRLMGRESLGTT